MPSKLRKIDFPFDQMKLTELYYDENYEKGKLGVSSVGTKKVLGRDLYFENYYADRPYIYNGLVMSLDGKIAFNDSPVGPLIVKENKFIGEGKIIDYWILNLLRGAADAIFVGTNSINAEIKSGGTGHCYDEEIEIFRESIGKNPIPLRIVVSLNGKDINYNAAEIKSDQTATVFYTTKCGAENIEVNQPKEVIRIEEKNAKVVDFDKAKIYTIICGDYEFDHKLGMKIMKKMGIDTLFIESPTVSHIFMQEKILDEMFLSYSCVYLGGNSISMGMKCTAFTSIDHPHTKLVSIYMYNQHYLSLRHKVIY